MKANTRAAVYFGDNFRSLCDAMGVGCQELQKAQVISPGTYTKLRRRYRGGAVERPKRDRIVRYLQTRAEETGYPEDVGPDDIRLCLLPAIYSLTGEARDLMIRVPRLDRRHKLFMMDKVGEAGLARLAHGAFAVRKHIEIVAEHVWEHAAMLDLIDESVTADTFIQDEAEDHNYCFPTIYGR